MRCPSDGSALEQMTAEGGGGLWCDTCGLIWETRPGGRLVKAVLPTGDEQITDGEMATAIQELLDSEPDPT